MLVGTGTTVWVNVLVIEVRKLPLNSMVWFITSTLSTAGLNVIDAFPLLVIGAGRRLTPFMLLTLNTVGIVVPTSYPTLTAERGLGTVCALSA